MKILKFILLMSIATTTYNRGIKNKYYFKEENKSIDLLKINAYIESKNNYALSHKSGYIGAYMFSRIALIDIGYDKKLIDTLFSTIKNNTFDTTLFGRKEQDIAANKMLHRAEYHYFKDIKKYIGRNIGGVLITRERLLTASFLGHRSVIEYVKSNGKINRIDGNGQSIKDRMLKI